MTARFWRTLAGVLILVLLAGFGVLLVPVYVRNFRFERSLGELVRQGSTLQSPDELVRVRVTDRAARLGLPVRPDQVRLKRSPGRLAIEVRYIVPIDLPVYSVDLHFRPSAGN
jgi:hypothetical protein